MSNKKKISTFCNLKRFRPFIEAISYLLATIFFSFFDAFPEFDTDYSGNIDFPEFCEMMRAQMSCDNDQEMIRLAFRVLDGTGEGSIKSSSFKHLMMNIGRLALDLN